MWEARQGFAYGTAGFPVCNRSENNTGSLDLWMEVQEFQFFFHFPIWTPFGIEDISSGKKSSQDLVYFTLRIPMISYWSWSTCHGPKIDAKRPVNVWRNGLTSDWGAVFWGCRRMAKRCFWAKERRKRHWKEVSNCGNEEGILRKWGINCIESLPWNWSAGFQPSSVLLIFFFSRTQVKWVWCSGSKFHVSSPAGCTTQRQFQFVRWLRCL